MGIECTDRIQVARMKQCGRMSDSYNELSSVRKMSKTNCRGRDEDAGFTYPIIPLSYLKAYRPQTLIYNREMENNKPLSKRGNIYVNGRKSPHHHDQLDFLTDEANF